MSDTQKDKKGLATKDSDERFLSVFKALLRNEHHAFVVQKTEKLASALYMVTGFIPQDDPLRARLRVCALELISTSADPDKAQDTLYQSGFTSRCLEIGAILKLAEQAGFISNMNAHVLCDEYAELATFIQNHHDKVFGGATVHDNLGNTALFSYANSPLPPPYPHSKTLKKDWGIKRTNKSKGHLNRKDAILRLLDKKDKITIKDAVASIEDCSEKTIQRELIALVQEGVLLKEGERRWSSYRRAR